MSLKTLEKRINYCGGAKQQNRMIQNKLRTLKRALLYSYQAATIILQDGKEFRCLINPDKNIPDYDNKILSIPYKDICLNAPMIGKRTQGEVETNIKPGDVFIQKNTGTHWLVFLQSLDEKAYFRSQIRKCEAQALIGKNKYWIYIRGPVESEIEWKNMRSIRSDIVWNTLNYSIVFYITADENTKEYLTRFAKIKISDPRFDKLKTWEIAGVNPYFGDGIIQVFANQYFENSIQDEIAEQQQPEEEIIDQNLPFISGLIKVPQYSSEIYTINNANNGKWILQENDGREIDLHCSQKNVRLNFTNKIGKCNLIYRVQNLNDIVLPISIIAL